MEKRRKEERQKLLYRRVRELQRGALKRQMAAISVMTAALGCCLFMMILSAGRLSPINTGGSYAGASFLSDNAGGYVLVAVIAFMTGVIITAAIYFYRRNRKNR